MQKEEQHNSKVIGVIFSMIVIVAVVAVAYILLQIEVDSSGVSASDEYRGVGGFWKLWLNGYLGHYFQFQHLGNLNWLAVPVLAIAFIRQKRSRTEYAFLFFYVLCVLLVVSFGYFTYRYKYTIQILVVPAVLYYLWLLLQKPGRVNWKLPFFVLITAVAMFNFWFWGWWKQMSVFLYYPLLPVLLYVSWTLFRSPKYRVGGKVAGALFVLFLGFLILRAFRGDDQKALDRIARTTFFFRTIPEEVFRYVDEELPTEAVVLTNNSPGVYYYTDAKAVYYKGVMDYCYQYQTSITEKNKGTTDEPVYRSPEEVRDFVTDSLGCTHLFTADFQEQFNPVFSEFVQTYCKELVRDEPGYILYKIENTNLR